MKILILNICSKYFKISISKCIFHARELDFLGFNTSKEAIKHNANKLQGLNNFHPPNDSKTLRQLIGMVNFYRKLIREFSDLIFPLTESIHLNPNTKQLILTAEEVIIKHNIIKLPRFES